MKNNNFDNMTLKDNPAIMTIIINIQTMERNIGCKQTPFYELEKMIYSDLLYLQNELITFDC